MLLKDTMMVGMVERGVVGGEDNNDKEVLLWKELTTFGECWAETGRSRGWIGEISVTDSKLTGKAFLKARVDGGRWRVESGSSVANNKKDKECKGWRLFEVPKAVLEEGM